MDDPRTVWLIAANLALGVIVLLFCALVVAGVVREYIGRARRRRGYRAELNRDLGIMLRAARRGKGH